MRRIGIAVAILATTLYSSALAQSLRPSYSPDGTSESREASTPPTQRSIVHGSNPAPRQLAAKPRNAAAQLPRTQAKTQPKTQTQVQSQAQVQALPQIALQPQPATPNRGVHDFFAAIFAGPIMFAALRPAEPQYGMSPANAPAYAPQAYASASQADRVDYSIDPKFLRQTVAYNGSDAPGTIIVSLRAREDRHQGHRNLSSRMSEHITALGKQPRETLVEQEGIFALAQIRERIELSQRAIDFAGMAHDEATVRQTIEKSDE